MKTTESTRQAGGDDGAGSSGSAYRGTLNLPATDFSMKANLVQNEPASLKRWANIGLYERLRKERAGRDTFVFHDGPPYANGDIHLGHLMNKCLKDFVVRSKGMMGLDCPYVPGWDCHGLPIEHKVMSTLVESGKVEKLLTLEPWVRRTAVRRECHKYAEKYVKLQSGQMQRLLTLADYENPYLTIQPGFEEAVLEVFADLVEQGLVYRALKPVHWSIANETALAEAELEYMDRTDTSVYVDFECADAAAVYDAFGLDRHARPDSSPSFMIWTTTPWTLPANLAVAVNERYVYALVRIDGAVTVLAEGLVEKVAALAKAEDVEILATTTGDRLVGLSYRHPFITSTPKPLADPDADTSACYKVYSAEYVTLEDGTGLVHTAPGHGTEDYETGKRVGLPIYCPVLGDGKYDTTAPNWLVGKTVWDANKLVTEHLRASGHLFFDQDFEHSYPHDWRSKTPVIFRCTEQWFVSVDVPMKRDGRTMREAALAETETGVAFTPEKGRNRFRSMFENRPDWCISRQRAWGLPITAFTTPGGATVLTPALVRAISKVFGKQGSDAWFTGDASSLLGAWDWANDADLPAEVRDEIRSVGVAALSRGEDILDVWFESGATWHAVMRKPGRGFPSDLYLEGSDQHRGWYQSSLACALGSAGVPPFRHIVTHGFMVGKDGKKLSKSSGDNVNDLFTKYGADVLRWWVCSLSYENDVKVDDEFFKLAGESYRKIRNTLRFMLSNLGDFKPSKGGDCATGHCIPLSDYPPASIDAWVLGEYNRTARGVIDAYARYDFRSAHSLLYDFCNEILSAVYLAAVKDRLYCDRPDAPRRRRTQTTLWDLTDGLCRLLAPVLCHTADEAFRALHAAGTPEDALCVHTAEFIEHYNVNPDARWGKVFEAREHAMRALEGFTYTDEQGKARKHNTLDAELVLPDPSGELASFDNADLCDLLGVSRVSFDASASSPRVVDLRDQPQCQRSWKRDGTVRHRSDGGLLSDRDAEAVGVA